MSFSKKISRFLGRNFYYKIARNLPISYSRGGKIAKHLRAYCASKFLVFVGKDVNIEKGAMITSTMEIGDRSGVGINAKMHGKVIIGKNVTPLPI